MTSPTCSPPTLNRKTLEASGIQPADSLVLSSLNQFSPLDSAEIQDRANLPAQQQRFNDLSLLPEQNEIRHKNHFNLSIDRDAFAHRSSIRIADCSHFSVQGTSSQITPSPAGKFLVEITNCSHFTINGIRCASGRHMLLVSGSSSFLLQDCKGEDMEGCGIILLHCDNFRIADCRFYNNLSAGIMVTGDSYDGEIINCSCARSRGFFNHDAGIHLCQTSPAVTVPQVPEQCHEPLPISAKTKRPHHLVIRDCLVTHCRAQGIYLEGAINCLIEDNVMLNNNKEGVCFDWGSSYNIFRGNVVSLNGERESLTPKEIEIDFIAEYPLLEDGSSSMKLPGISIDNGCLNLIRDNRISSNYGGGIKMIRSALFNEITDNQLLYNAIGANRFVPHFHGITVLGLGPKNEEFRNDRPYLLDFMPSTFNTISKNTIKESRQGLFFDKRSANNIVTDNTVSQESPDHSSIQSVRIRAVALLRRLAAQSTPGR